MNSILGYRFEKEKPQLSKFGMWLRITFSLIKPVHQQHHLSGVLAKHTCSYSHIYYETKPAFFLELKVPSDSKDQKIPGHLLGSGRLTFTELTSVTGVSILSP